MPKSVHTIGVVAPSRRLDERVPEMVQKVLDEHAGSTQFNIRFHEQCFFQRGHFAGSDADRTAAFIDYSNDPEIDTIWFARGGYGAARIADTALASLTATARLKTFLGYSDTGFLLARLYKEGMGTIVHGPMPNDIVRENGDIALHRVFDFLASNACDERRQRGSASTPVIALNLTVLIHLLSTTWLPKLDGHVLIIEDVDEHMYCLDRSMFTLATSKATRNLAGLRLGRFSQVPKNDIDFGLSAEEIVSHWCVRADIPYLGRANIGHDVDNAIIAFG